MFKLVYVLIIAPGNRISFLLAQLVSEQKEKCHINQILEPWVVEKEAVAQDDWLQARIGMKRLNKRLNTLRL